MIKRILVGLVTLVVLLVIISFFLPSSYRVSRTAVIKAPVEKVFAEFNDFNSWAQWNTFDDEYTDIKYNTSNPSAGAGAKQTWTSKKGNGAMEITESVPNKQIKMTLRFEGFDDPMLGDFQFAPVAEGTQVTWTDEGKTGNNPFFKYMCLMMDSMIGGNMEKSFANVKKICE